MRRLVILLLLASHTAGAQLPDFAFDRLSIEHGLSNPVVTAIVQDAKGFMWFGTYDGLNRYDGYEFKTYYYDPDDSSTISDNRITCLYVDSRGNLWVGTNLGGVNLYHGYRDTFQRYTRESAQFSLSANRVETVYEDSHHNLWVGTNEGLNLYNYETGKFAAYRRDDNDPLSLKSSHVYAIAERSREELVVMTNGPALNRYDRALDGFTGMGRDSVQINLLRTARVLLSDQRGDLWIGTMDDGLLRYHDGFLKQYRRDDTHQGSLSHNLVKCILEDDLGNIWVGTDGGGLNIYNRKSDDFRIVKADPENPNSLSGNAIHALYEDRSGIIWVGTFGGGVNIYNREKSKFIHIGSGVNNNATLSQKSVLAIYEDQTGKVWIGTDGGGLNVFDPRTGLFRYYRHDVRNPYSISSDVVKCIYEDSRGNLWIGTYLGGLNLFDRRTGRFHRIAPENENELGFVVNIIWAIHEDNEGDLWLATLGNGLCVYSPAAGTFRHFPPFSGYGSLGDYNITKMVTASDGTLWIATEDNGINLFEHGTGRFKSFRHDPKDENTISSNHVFTLFEDSEANIWIGTSQGLDVYSGKERRFYRYSALKNMPGKTITNIVEDYSRHLWLSSEKGLIRLKRENDTYEIFDLGEGGRRQNFNANSGIRARTGELYFGGMNGLEIFKPAGLRKNMTPPAVVFTDFRIFNKPVAVGENELLKMSITYSDDITLSYKESVVSFRFAALNYTSPWKNEYAYRMEGFDADWTYSSTVREATYTNLDPGIYTFKVKASNNDGVWNEQGISLRIVVTPPWWKTVWFRLAIAGALLVIGISAYKYRTHHIRTSLRAEKQRELDLQESRMREERLQHEKAISELGREKLEAEVSSKNAALATTVMSVVRQNETLSHIRDELISAMKDPGSAARELRKLARLIDQNLKADEAWSQYEQLFNQIHENFLQRLKERYPQLTSNDLKLCAYLRMGLDSKDIAALMSLSLRGVESLRYRVRKKMNLDTNINLAGFIITFQ